LHCGTAEKPRRAKLVLSAMELLRFRQRGTGRLPVAGQGRQGHLAAGSCGATSAPGVGPVLRGAARSPVRNETVSVGEQPGCNLSTTQLQTCRQSQGSIPASPEPRVHAPRQEIHPGAGLARWPCDPAALRLHRSREFIASPESRRAMWHRSPTDGRDLVVVPCRPGDYLLKRDTSSPPGLSPASAFVFFDRAPMRPDSVEWGPNQADP
jgi:hypothetical protein